MGEVQRMASVVDDALNSIKNCESSPVPSNWNVAMMRFCAISLLGRAARWICRHAQLAHGTERDVRLVLHDDVRAIFEGEAAAVEADDLEQAHAVPHGSLLGVV